MQIPLAVSRGSKVASAWANSVVAQFAPRRGVSLAGATQSIPNGSATAFSWSTEYFDEQGWITVPGTTLTVPGGWDGRYLIMANARWATTSLGTQPMVDIVWNGSSWLSTGGLSAVGVHTVCGIISLTAGNTIFARGYQNSGGAVNCTPSLEIVPIGSW